MALRTSPPPAPRVLTVGCAGSNVPAMNEDAPDSDIRQRLELIGLSYADWELESEALRRAADGAAGTGLVDGAHLVRAGQIADEIDAELAALDQVAQSLDPEVAGQVQSVRDRLVALRDAIRNAARQMHGLT